MLLPSTPADELNELKGQFLASLNHEIRTPLSGILGMADLLLETELTEEQKEYVASARLCAENLLEMLSVTLEFSALSANQVTLEETEFRVRDALEKMVEGRTSIIIAHRLSTIQRADRILVMHKGRLRESGNHQELLALHGIYWKLYQLQYKDQERASGTLEGAQPLRKPTLLGGDGAQHSHEEGVRNG